MPQTVGNDADAPTPAVLVLYPVAAGTFVSAAEAVEILRELTLRLLRRLRLVIEADYLAARQQRPVVLRLFRRAVLAVDVDEGGGHIG